MALSPDTSHAPATRFHPGGLREVFDLDDLYVTRLTNVSTRGFVGTGNDVLIGGFIVDDGPKNILVRARGPVSVPGFLTDPVMDLRTIDNDPILVCDNWRSCGTEQEIIDAGFDVGLNEADAAVIVTLENGGYTPIVSGAGGTTGVGIVEVIELD